MPVPAPSPTPTPTAMPAGTPVPQSRPTNDAALSAIDTMGGEPAPETPPPQPDPAPEKPAAPAKTAPVKSAAPAKTAPEKSAAPAKTPAPAKNPAEKPEEVPAEPTPSEPGAPAAEKPIEQLAPKELREAYRGTKQKVTELEKQIAELRSKSSVVAPAEMEAANKRYEALNKQHEAAEQRLRELDFESSAEYRSKYHEPYVQVAQAAIQQVTDMQVVLPDSSTRAATAEDFWSIVQLGNTGQALQAAQKLFGDPAAAAYIMQLRGQVITAHNAGVRAKEEFKKTGAEQARLRQEQMKQQHQEVETLFKTTIENLQGEEPELYLPADGDDEGNALLESGNAEAQSAFTGTREENGKQVPLTPKELAAVNARLKAKAGAFDRQVAVTRRLQAQVKELEAKLNEYQTSEPGAAGPGGKPPGATGTGSMAGAESALESMATPGNGRFV